MIDVLSEETLIKNIGGITYELIPCSKPSASPFTLVNYDFEDGFYRGEFDFHSPVNGNKILGTPEKFSRHKIVAALEDYIDSTGNDSYTILDLGCGTLDIARTIEPKYAKMINLINCDISGPWSMGSTSSLVIGTNKLKQRGLLKNFKNISNIEYDFNASAWPFKKESFDFVLANLSVCHVNYERKKVILQSIFESIKQGGTLIVGDVFEKDESGSRFTEAGLRGPEECWGYLSTFNVFLEMSKGVGFTLDPIAEGNLSYKRNYQTKEELELAANNKHLTMAINKAVWFIELKK